jgi:LysM repeat protein
LQSNKKTISSNLHDSNQHKSVKDGHDGEKMAEVSHKNVVLKNIFRGIPGLSRLSLRIAVFLFLVIPVMAYASGLFNYLGSLFSGTSNTQTNPSNSQTIALLEAPASPTGSVNNQPVSIVGDTSLVAESPDPTASSTSPSSDQISIYVVHQGDTLSDIAKMFGVSKNTIIWANNIKNGKVSPGDQLVILPISGVEYTVKSGDTLKSIAKKFKGDIDEIASFNNISSTAKLAVGDIVIIPDGEISVTSSVITSGSSTSGPGSSLPASGALPAPSNSPAVGSRGPNYPVYVGYYMRPIIGGIKTQGIHGHNGVDLASTYGTNIMASADGTVIIAKSGGWNGGYGSYVVISHDNGTQTLYGHLSSVLVSAGQVVTQGQVIGKMGSTGDSTGTHLHFEIRGATNPF